MPKPKSITEVDIDRWLQNINKDDYVSPLLKIYPSMKEVCLAGLWLCEELKKLGCPNVLICRIQWTAGKLSVGKDAWDVHQDILEDYKNKKLVIEEDKSEIEN